MAKLSPAAKIAFLYFFLGIAWITFTDKLSFSGTHSSEPFYQLQTYKGNFYVLVTSLLLYFLIKRLNNRLNQAQQEYKVLFENNPNPMWIVDPETQQFKEVNKAALDQYGYSRSEFLALDAFKIRPAEDQEKFRNSTNLPNKEYNKSGPWRHLKKSGEIIDVDVYRHTIDFQGKKALLILGIDITDRKKVEEERDQLIETLSHQNKDLQQYAYITSHNLRAPIANIIGLVNLYNPLNEGSLNEAIIGNLKQASVSLDSVVKDLNALVAIRNHVNAEKQQIKFLEVFEDVCASIASNIDYCKANIQVDFSQVPTVYSVKIYVQSILLNLITNAIKYRSPDREVKIEVKTYLEENFICLAVTDNGLGLDLAKNRTKLFGLYKRLHSHIEGKGIGLYLVKVQAEALGGRVEIESEEGKGSCFKVYFPKS